MTKRKQLSEQQLRFCEMVARGIPDEEAYREVFGFYNPNKGLLKGLISRLKKNPMIVAEIEMQQSMNEQPKAKQQKTVKERIVNVMEDEDSETDIEWTREQAFKKLNTFLKCNDEMIILIQERPQLFASMNKLISKAAKVVSAANNAPEWREQMMEIFENLEDMTCKLCEYDPKLYTQTVNTGITLMKEMNNITGITKNATELKKQSFEERLLKMIARSQGPEMQNELEECAFDE